ncbi:MAG TPA: cell division protein ZapE [Rhizomicrobium sp.]|nr:cell division protein ZapE [Rhizomicrobium sp.]
MSLIERYRAAIAQGELKQDAAQGRATARLAALAKALKSYKPGRRLFFASARPPRGIYLWGDVGRGKSMLMDLFFAEALVAEKRRIHFNEFMADTHAAIHAERQRAGSSDPIPPVARAIAEAARLLCFDEFQVTDVADAMILGRLFEQLFQRGVVVVATSNVAPDRLYEAGLNRQLFLPFIAEFKQRLDVLELDGAVDYRLHRISGLSTYIHPLGPAADAAMDATWFKLTDRKQGAQQNLTILGRVLRVPQAAKGVARFDFTDLCAQPLAGADYLAVARAFHTVLIDRVPRLGPSQRDEARRIVLLIDTLYDEGVKLICSAEAEPGELYVTGDGVDTFRRTVSRLHEMQSEDYLKRGHGIHGNATELV